MEFLPDLVALDSPAFEEWRQARQKHYAQIRGQKPEVRKAGEISTPPAIAPMELTSTQAHNLPRQLTPFIGRQMEIATIRNKLLDERYPWLTIVGEGGVGKT